MRKGPRALLEQLAPLVQLGQEEREEETALLDPLG